MHKQNGLWLPDGDTEFQEYNIRRYQEQARHEALGLLRGRYARLALDIGAHVGLWSMHLSRMFHLVYAFEPNPKARECFTCNIPDDNAVLIPFALGSERKTLSLDVTDGFSGRSFLTEGDGVEVHRLDDLKLQNLDFVKIDVEGYEAEVLMGGRETLTHWKPVMVVEQKANTDALPILRDMGCVVHNVIGGDIILSWP